VPAAARAFESGCDTSDSSIGPLAKVVGGAVDEREQKIARLRRLEALGEHVADELVARERVGDAEVAQRLRDPGCLRQGIDLERRRQAVQGDRDDEGVGVVGGGDQRAARAGRFAAADDLVVRGVAREQADVLPVPAGRCGAMSTTGSLPRPSSASAWGTTGWEP